MSTKIQLTRNAIMYISLGFLQPCILQVLALRQDPTSGLEMVVYDGTVYAGALLPRQQSTRLHRTATGQSQEQDPSRRIICDQEQPRYEVFPRELDVIWVKAVLVGKNQPLQVSHMKVVRTGLSDVLGTEILSLEEYMRRRRFSSVCCVQRAEDLQERTRKQLKNNEQTREISTHPTNQSQKGSEIYEKQDIHKPQVSFDQDQDTLKNEMQFELKQPLAIFAAVLKPNQPLLTDQPERVGLEQTDPPVEEHLSHREQGFKQIQKPKRLIEGVLTRQDDCSNSCNAVQVQTSQKVSQTFQVVVKSHQRIIQTIRDEDNEVTQIKPAKFHKSRVIDLIDDNEPITQKLVAQGSAKESHLMIADLYERMHRFSILCRINSINHFRSQKGNLCTKLMLIDKQGDEIQCALFEKAHEKYNSSSLELVKGRAYVFENGEVEKDDNGCLSISVPWSGIRQTKNILQSFNPTKMRRVAQIQSIQSGHFLGKAVENSSKSINSRRAYAKELHACGILKRIKDEAKLVNNQFRIVGLLCDPEHQKSINFGLYVDQLTSFPLSGAVISLHNMRVAEYEGTFRLQSTKRSYFLIQNNNSHLYYADLQESSLKETWKLKDYKNISEVTYVPRNIAALKQLLQNMIEHSLCYSEIDCNVANIFEKKEYTACSVCHHETKPPKGLQIYCYYCKKIEKWNRRFIFTAQVADSTGSLDVTIYSSEVQPFINSAADEYANLSRQERKNLLELSSFQNLLVKMKSQKIVGGSSHIVFRAEKMSHKRGLDYIKEHTIQSKTRYAPAW